MPGHRGMRSPQSSLAAPCSRPFAPRSLPSAQPPWSAPLPSRDRKSTRLNSSHLVISYAVFCLKKKKHRVVALSHSTVSHVPDIGEYVNRFLWCSIQWLHDHSL